MRTPSGGVTQGIEHAVLARGQPTPCVTLGEFRGDCDLGTVKRLPGLVGHSELADHGSADQGKSYGDVRVTVLVGRSAGDVVAAVRVGAGLTGSASPYLTLTRLAWVGASGTPGGTTGLHLLAQDGHHLAAQKPVTGFRVTSLTEKIPNCI